MKITPNAIFAAAPHILGNILFKKKYPLAVSWRLTYRCNRRCLYCHLSELQQGELETEQILSILDQLSNAGTKFISFTGGEPLLRQDIGIIIRKARALNINTSLNTNGTMLPEKLNELKDANCIRVSLDGPKAVNDSIRGIGSFENAIEAIRLAKKEKIRVEIATVLSKYNVDCIGEVVSIARDLNVRVMFQPVMVDVFGSGKSNSIIPEPANYRRAITYLMDCKKKGCKEIINPLPLLEYMLTWPGEKAMNCTAGDLIFRIEPDGMMIACGWMPIPDRSGGALLTKNTVREALDILKKPECTGCWCAVSLEINMLFSLKPHILAGIIKELIR